MKKNLRQIIGSSLLAMSIITQAIIPPLTAFAETVNADGSITKTATAEYEECDGGWVEHCSGGYTQTCVVEWEHIAEYCHKCNGTDPDGPHTNSIVRCEHGNWSTHTVEYPCAHGYTSSHDVDHECSHGYLYSHDVFEGYHNTTYGYSSYSSSTFKVWPISATAESGLSYTLNVVGASATDAAIAGKTVKITASGAPADTELKVTNSSTGEVKVLSGSNMTYSFAMPASPTTLSVQYVDSVRVTDLVYGQTLSEATFTDYNPPCAGHWEWDNPDTIPNVSDSNVTEFPITFYPDDPATPVTTRTKKVIVTKYAAALTGASITASDIDYGQSLADVVFTGTLPQLNGVDIPGTFSWVNPAETPNAGTRSFEMRFTPDDTANIETITFDVVVTINQLPITLTEDMIASIAASGITYEQSLADSTLTGYGPLPGHYEWKDPTIRPAVADSNTTPYEVMFVPDDTNYASADATCTLEISKKAYTFAPEDISRIIASDISYGQSLADSTIDGFKPVPGSYYWVDDTVYPNVNDPNNYQVKFVPDDLDNYEEVIVGNIHVSVNKARPDISIEQIEAIVVTPIDYLQTLGDSTITAESGTPGVFEWEDPTIAPSVADSGITGYNIKFTPDDTDNFDTILIPITITVNKINPPVPTDLADNISSTGIQFGQTLGDSTLSYTGSEAFNGTLVWKDETITPAMADSDTTEFEIEFVYADDVNYNRLPYVAKVHVDKAPAPAEYVDMTETENIFLGQSKALRMGSILPLAEIKIEAMTYSDPNGIFNSEPTVSEDRLSFSVKSDKELADKQAEIDLELSCRDYLNFDAQITVVTSYCDHRDLSYGVGRESATCTSEGYTGNTVCNICGLTLRYGTTTRMKDHWEIARNEIPATCTTKGYSGDLYCFICDEFLGYGHETDFAPHTEGEQEIISKPTETREGLAVYHCSVCGAFIRREVLPMLGETSEPSEPSEEHSHSWSDTYSYDEFYHWRTCSECNGIEEAHKHTFDSGVRVGTSIETMRSSAFESNGEIADTEISTDETNEAPEGSEEKIRYTCVVCGYYYDTDIPKQDNPHTGINIAVLRTISLLCAAGAALLLGKKCKVE